MRYRPFGRSGLALSTLGLRLTAEILSKNGLAEKLILSALENGINTFHFDLAKLPILQKAASIFSVIDRKLLFISITAHDSNLVSEGMVYRLEPFKDRLRQIVKDTGLQWLDLLLFDHVGSSTIPDDTLRFINNLRQSRMLHYIGANAETAELPEIIASRRFDVIKTGFDIDSSWDKRRQIDSAIAHEMNVFAQDYFPTAYKKASELIPAKAKRSWFGGKPENPLAGAGSYAFLHQTPDWTPEELCLGYALSQPSMACIFIEPESPDHLEALAQVPERHLPSSVPAQIEMARFTDHAPKSMRK